jgi:hypothetical protein
MVDRVQTSAIRSKLLPLRQTSDPSLKRQTSVATGNANSARDKLVSVLTAADLAVRIRDLSAMIEKLAMAIDAIQAADHSISAITELVRLAQALVRRAQETTDGPSAQRSQANLMRCQKSICLLAGLTSTESTYSAAMTSRFH